MRHNKAGKRLGRNTPHRTAMMRNMVTSLLEHDRITTTDARAKELRKIADKMITLGKRGDLHARRQAASVIRDRKVVAKLFDRLGPRYSERPGGYTRIIKLGQRAGDNAALSLIELVEEEFSPKPGKKKPAPAEETAPEKVAAPVEAAADAGVPPEQFSPAAEAESQEKE